MFVAAVKGRNLRAGSIDCGRPPAPHDRGRRSAPEGEAAEDESAALRGKPIGHQGTPHLVVRGANRLPPLLKSLVPVSYCFSKDQMP